MRDASRGWRGHDRLLGQLPRAQQVRGGGCAQHGTKVVEDCAQGRGAPNTLIGTGINPGAYATRPEG